MQELMEARPESPVVLNTNANGLNKRTILLVEDEEMVRELMCEVLEMEGYEVLACAHPEEAIAVCRRHPGPIDLLLTDVVLPGMNGREMANRILEILPELRTVFMSGYTDNALLHEGEVNPQLEYLQKPFSLLTLTRKLTQVLGTLQQSTQLG